MSFTITEHKELNDGLLSDWQKLWDCSSFSHFFNHPAWFLTCKEIYPSDSYRIITVSDNNGLAAVLPVHEERKFGVKTLACPGGKRLDRCALLYRDIGEEALSSLFGYLIAKRNFYLSEANASIAEAAKRCKEGIATRKSSVSPYIPLLKDPFAYLSPKQGKKIARLLKRLEGRLEFRRFFGEAEGIDTAVIIDQKSRKAKEGRETFFGETDIRFLKGLIKNFGKQTVVETLYLDGRPFVFSLEFLYKNVCHAHVSSYDSSGHAFSPRKLLLRYTLPCLRREGIETFDFSRGTNSLKREFTPLFRTQYDIYYAKNPLVRMWWKAANIVCDEVLDSKMLYGMYLWVKRATQPN